MKKGFTLIEILSIIVILGIIAVLVLPKISTSSTDKKQKEYDKLVELIENAGKSYLSSHPTEVAVEVNTLLSNEYLTNNITNPFTNTNITGCISRKEIDGINKYEFGNTCVGNVSLTVDLDNGSIDTNPAGEYSTGSSITLSSPAKPNFIFAGWIVTLGNSTISGNNLTIGTGDTEVRALWIYNEPILNGAYPRLDAGMIPVTISNAGIVTSVNASSNNWYSYENKIWANAVLVKSEGVHTREYYKTHYEEIDPSDILAYFVWIPRYRYQLFNAEGADGTTPISIPITFESADTTKSNGTTDGAWLTHPGFTYDGEPLNGIWVGKFETTPTSGSACSNSPDVDNCKDENPTILPNVSSLRYQDVSTQFPTSQKFRSDYYGLNNESRMMKNNEWGAVAYLSHSVYGINTEVRINNNNLYTTGCGANVVNDGATATCEIEYGSGVVNYPQSTTGNISGIFDISGGAYEHIMGVLGDSAGNEISGSNSSLNSGYNGKLADNSYKNDGVNFPNYRYYKIYNEINWEANPNYFGEALGETRGWYGDYKTFVSNAWTWFVRGGFNNGSVTEGAFHFSGTRGCQYNNVSFRVVIS